MRVSVGIFYANKKLLNILLQYALLIIVLFNLFKHVDTLIRGTGSMRQSCNEEKTSRKYCDLQIISKLKRHK